jgi:hypothetical protein
MRLSITVRGAEEAQAQLAPDAVHGALQQALEEVADDLSTSKGGGLGVQVNSLSATVGTNLAVVESSLIWPRTTGESWLARSEEEAESVAVIALEAAAEDLAQAMA